MRNTYSRMAEKLSASSNNPTTQSRIENYRKHQAMATEAARDLLTIKQKLGARYFTALEKAYKAKTLKLTIAQAKALYVSVKGGKKSVNQTTFLGANVAMADVFHAFKEAKYHRQSFSGYVALCKVNGAQRKTAKIHHKIAEKMDSMRLSGVDGQYYYRFLLVDLIKDQIKGAFPSVSGEKRVSVKLVSDPAKVSFSSSTHKGEQYSRSCSYRKTNLSITATLPSNWLKRVCYEGLTELDGMITINASTPLQLDPAQLRDNPFDKLAVYAATWLRRSRGTSYTVIRGFIAVGYAANGSQYSFHGKTLNSALNGLIRKHTTQRVNYKSKAGQIIKRAMTMTGVSVTVSDSYSVGNCVSGTLDFCYRHGIDPTQSIELAELAKIAVSEPRRELLAILSDKTK